jgi:hypothetical protein
MSILVIASLATAGLASLAAGFAVRARPLSPPGASHHRGLVALDDNVPPLLARHLDVDQDGLLPRMDTIALWGRVRVPLISTSRSWCLSAMAV